MTSLSLHISSYNTRAGSNDDAMHPKGQGIRTGSLSGKTAIYATPVPQSWQEHSGKILFPPLCIASSTEKTIAKVSAGNTTLLTIRKR